MDLLTLLKYGAGTVTPGPTSIPPSAGPPPTPPVALGGSSQLKPGLAAGGALSMGSLRMSPGANSLSGGKIPGSMGSPAMKLARLLKLAVGGGMSPLNSEQPKAPAGGSNPLHAAPPAGGGGLSLHQEDRGSIVPPTQNTEIPNQSNIDAVTRNMQAGRPAIPSPKPRPGISLATYQDRGIKGNNDLDFIYRPDGMKDTRSPQLKALSDLREPVSAPGTPGAVLPPGQTYNTDMKHWNSVNSAGVPLAQARGETTGTTPVAPMTPSGGKYFREDMAAKARGEQVGNVHYTNEVNPHVEELRAANAAKMRQVQLARQTQFMQQRQQMVSGLQGFGQQPGMGNSARRMPSSVASSVSSSVQPPVTQPPVPQPVVAQPPVVSPTNTPAPAFTNPHASSLPPSETILEHPIRQPRVESLTAPPNPVQNQPAPGAPITSWAGNIGQAGNAIGNLHQLINPYAQRTMALGNQLGGLISPYARQMSNFGNQLGALMKRPAGPSPFWGGVPPRDPLRGLRLPGPTGYVPAPEGVYPFMEERWSNQGPDINPFTPGYRFGWRDEPTTVPGQVPNVRGSAHYQ